MLNKLKLHQRNILIVLGVLVIGFGWTVRDSYRFRGYPSTGNFTITVGAGILVAGFLSAKPRESKDEHKNPDDEP